MRKWAIAIGINQYQFMQPLSFAQQDAQALKTFLVREAGFAPEQCVLMTDTSSPLWGRPTYPSRENIKGWIDLLSQQYLQPGDLLWIFFSGCSACWQGKDYLLPIAGNPSDLPGTAISLESIFNQLKMIPAETLLLLIDTARAEGGASHNGVGAQTAQLAEHLGIPTIVSCQPDRFFRETPFLGHGFVTAALLDGLRYQPEITLAQMDQFLDDRLKIQSEYYQRRLQKPLVVSPPDQLNQPLLPAQLPATERGTPAESNVPAQWERLPASAHGRHAAVPHPPTSVQQRSQKTPASIGFSRSDAVAPEQALTQRQGDGPETGKFSAHTAQTPGAETPVAANQTESTDFQFVDESPLGRSLWWGSVALATFLLAGGVCWKHWAFMTQGSQLAKKPTADGQIVAAQPSSTQPQQSLATSTNTIAAQSTYAPVKKSLTAPITRVANRSIQQPDDGSTTAVDDSDDSRPASFSSKAKSSSVQPSKTKPSNQSSQSVAQSLEEKPAGLQQSLLNSAKAKIAISSNQASLYWDAIQDASKIQPDDPQNPQAQQEIAGWSQDILTIATWRAKQRNFDTAIMAAALIPSNQPIFSDAQEAIARWCPSLSQQAAKKVAHRRQAKAICLQQ
ncbi:caspase family protein [Kovacikia minuta CCNUW1]|uniref:caspase family protein n=1 Tax=Kovacikia minuta TaxID=2931930 RepID=UPI001CC92DF8|nr:caspase family protein [Kovacikia minuta]UBF29717.1 caspase family protein [Kovacikia minuta CCNUW1]